MKRTLIFFILFFLFFNSFAKSGCPLAELSSSANFCESFKKVAQCHCEKKGVPRFLCRNMKFIHFCMIKKFGTENKTCLVQDDTSVNICVDDWKCFWKGGRNSEGQLCSGTGNSCV